MTRSGYLKKTMWLGTALLTGLVGIALFAGAGAVDAGGKISWHTANTIAADAGDRATVESVNHAKTLSHAFRAASESVLPAVVTIQSQPAESVAASGNTPNRNVPEELRDHPFFKRYFDEMPEGSSRTPRQPGRVGMGSGVIVDSSGIILTNNHVVDGAGKLIVRLHDGREFEAQRWMTDPKTDIAVVVIESSGTLPVATIGDSSAMQIGDWVMAVGAPFGLHETVTAGIISAKSRGIGITDREEFLQTDAAINPGNSGGPLVNLNGEVVGINTAISSTNGGYQGIGFAIPIDLARWVGDELVTYGSVRRAFLGVGIQSVNDSLSKHFGLATVGGALVTEVKSGSPAATAGLRSGDVIVEFDGKEISSPRILQGAVERASVSETHQLQVLRDGKQLKLDCNVQAIPGEPPTGTTQEASRGTDNSRSEFEDIGLNVTDLSADVAQQLGMDGVEGVVVTGVRPNSPADRAGFVPGVVISKVGQTVVKNVGEFRNAMKSVSLDDGILMLARAGEGSRFVVIKNG